MAERKFGYPGWAWPTAPRGLDHFGASYDLTFCGWGVQLYCEWRSLQLCDCSEIWHGGCRERIWGEPGRGCCKVSCATLLCRGAIHLLWGYWKVLYIIAFLDGIWTFRHMIDSEAQCVPPCFFEYSHKVVPFDTLRIVNHVPAELVVWEGLYSCLSGCGWFRVKFCSFAFQVLCYDEQSRTVTDCVSLNTRYSAAAVDMDGKHCIFLGLRGCSNCYQLWLC